MTYALIQAEKATNDVAIRFSCRVLGVSAAGFYEWRRAHTQPCRRVRDDVVLTAAIGEIHRQSRGTYGAPRVHAELRLGRGIRVGRENALRGSCAPRSCTA